MSQHLSGDIGQSVRYEFGEFVFIPYKWGTWRVRVDQIISYVDMNHAERSDTEEQNHYILRLAVVGDASIGLEFSSVEELKAAAERLDWVFKKKANDAVV